MRGIARASIISLTPTSPKERDLAWFDYSTTADLTADGKILLFSEWGVGVKGTRTIYLRKTDGSDAVRCSRQPSRRCERPPGRGPAECRWPHCRRVRPGGGCRDSDSRMRGEDGVLSSQAAMQGVLISCPPC